MDGLLPDISGVDTNLKLLGFVIILFTDNQPLAKSDTIGWWRPIF